MAAKCNIVPSIVNKLNYLHWGVITKNVEVDILENYIEYLNCDTVRPIICNPSDCVNTTVNFSCTLAVAKISSLIDINVVTFFISDGDITGGKAPYTYNWSYETDDFDGSGAINLSQSILTVKPNKKANVLISRIVLTLTDANSCKVVKTCYLTPQGMQCANNYLPCLPITNFKVTNNKVLCPSLKGLLVSKK